MELNRKSCQLFTDHVKKDNFYIIKIKNNYKNNKILKPFIKHFYKKTLPVKITKYYMVKTFFIFFKILGLCLVIGFKNKFMFPATQKKHLIIINKNKNKNCLMYSK